MKMRVGRIPYINCFPVYGAIDEGLFRVDGTLVTGVPTVLNSLMAKGELDVSVVSVVEYAARAERYLMLPGLAISCDGPVRSVKLFSRVPAQELDGRRVLVSSSSTTSVALLELLFDDVWKARPQLVPGEAELSDVQHFDAEDHDARLVIGDAALLLHEHVPGVPRYGFEYDIGEEWRRWTGLPFVFAVWVARRTAPGKDALAVMETLTSSRDWGLSHLPQLADRAAAVTGVPSDSCRRYLEGLDYGLSPRHLAGLTEFFRRLAAAGRVSAGELEFLTAA